MKGRLIVFEGADGSGKSTQFARLCSRLAQEGTTFERLVFPQYDKPSSALIRMYLGGEFGTKPDDVNPYAASAFYAVDRYASMKQVWGDYYEEGGLLLADRYTSSNAVHQGAKCPVEEQEVFLRWLDAFEHERLGLPRADLVIYLDMPADCAEQLLRKREAETNTQSDIHEADADYLRACRRSGKRAAELLGWKSIACADKQGGLRTIEDIHEEIWRYISPLL